MEKQAVWDLLLRKLSKGNIWCLWPLSKVNIWAKGTFDVSGLSAKGIFDGSGLSAKGTLFLMALASQQKGHYFWWLWPLSKRDIIFVGSGLSAKGKKRKLLMHCVQSMAVGYIAEPGGPVRAVWHDRADVHRRSGAVCLRGGQSGPHGYGRGQQAHQLSAAVGPCQGEERLGGWHWSWGCWRLGVCFSMDCCFCVLRLLALKCFLDAVNCTTCRIIWHDIENVQKSNNALCM